MSFAEAVMPAGSATDHAIPDPMPATAQERRADWPLGVAQADDDGRITDASPSATALLCAFGDPSDLFAALAEAEPDLRAAARALAPGARLERRLRGPRGAAAALCLTRARDGFHVALADESRLSRAEAEAHRQRARFRAMADSALRAGVYALDAEGRVSEWSRSAERFEGLSPREALGLRLSELLDRGRFAANGEALLREAARSGESAFCGRRVGRSGPSSPMTVTLHAIRSAEGRLDGFVVIVRDAGVVTAREAELKRLAETDPLTGVLNRRAFFETAEAAIAETRAHGEPMALIAFDLDDFKALNDRFGHAAGDAALRALTETARGDVRDGDVIGRLGGDEFAIALPRADLDRATRIAERLRSGVERVRAAVAGGSATRITASFGVAAAVETAQCCVSDLLARADAALYRAKGAGKNRIVCA
jgi:diguanylate cyclase (GGDEF)-like protein/PAS domain S-box-containing protein